MATKSVLIAIVAIVVVTWVLISSINTIEAPINSNTGPTGTNGNTGNTAHSRGTGNATTHENGTVNQLIGNLSGQNPNGGSQFNLNLSFLNFFYKFLVAINHLLSPLYKFIDLILGAIAYLVGLIVNFLLKFVHINITVPNPAGLLGYSNPGSGGPQGSQNPNTHSVPPLITYSVMILIAIIVAIAGTASFSAFRKRTKKDDDEGDLSLLRAKEEEEKAEDYLFKPINIKTVEFSGWKKGNDLINPEIPEDLPIIYPAGTPLAVHLRNEARLSGNYTVLGEPGGSDVNISLNLGCFEATAEKGMEKESKIFKGVVVRDEISLLLRVNLSRIITEGAEVKTVRELINSDEFAGKIKDRKRLLGLIRSYERAYYGMKETDLNEFQRFLYGIRDTFEDARMALCGS